jgi:hypothetical protein
VAGQLDEGRDRVEHRDATHVVHRLEALRHVRLDVVAAATVLGAEHGHVLEGMVGHRQPVEASRAEVTGDRALRMHEQRSSKARGVVYPVDVSPDALHDRGVGAPAQQPRVMSSGDELLACERPVERRVLATTRCGLHDATMPRRDGRVRRSSTACAGDPDDAAARARSPPAQLRWNDISGEP